LSRFSGNLIYGPQPIIELDFGSAVSKGCQMPTPDLDLIGFTATVYEYC